MTLKAFYNKKTLNTLHYSDLRSHIQESISIHIKEMFFRYKVYH